jgi:hypothetical protein
MTAEAALAKARADNLAAVDAVNAAEEAVRLAGAEATAKREEADRTAAVADEAEASLELARAGSEAAENARAEAAALAAAAEAQAEAAAAKAKALKPVWEASRDNAALGEEVLGGREANARVAVGQALPQLPTNERPLLVAPRPLQ